MFLERRQFGERRIRIDRTVALARRRAGGPLPVRRPAVAAALATEATLVASATLVAVRPPPNLPCGLSCGLPLRLPAAACRCPCPCLENARAAAGRPGPRAAGLPARRRRPRPASRRQPAAHRCGACGNPGCGRAVRGDAARLWRLRRLHRERRPRRLRLARDGRDGADGCDRDAAGALPSGHRAARPRPFQALRPLRARLRPLQHAASPATLSGAASAAACSCGASAATASDSLHRGDRFNEPPARLLGFDGAGSGFGRRRRRRRRAAALPTARPLLRRDRRRHRCRRLNAIRARARPRARRQRLVGGDIAGGSSRAATVASELFRDADCLLPQRVSAAGASTTSGFGGSGAFFSMR